MNVLVTGANGFIGKNLCCLLENEGHTVLKVFRDTTELELTKMCQLADFCIHLAAEVNPKASSQDFVDKNITLTKNLTKLLGDNKACPILLTSTVHAGKTDNIYGKTKLESEYLISEYSNSNDSSVYVYKLPHVFGPRCKPNYNSVLTTWIVDALNGKEPELYESARDMLMTYVYVKDVCTLLVRQVTTKELLPVPNGHSITLEELKKTIQYMVTIDKPSEKISDFESKLSETIHYYREQLNA